MWEQKENEEPSEGAHIASKCQILHPILSEHPGQQGESPTPHGLLVPRETLRTSESTSTTQTQPVCGFPQLYNLAHIDSKRVMKSHGQGDQSTDSSVFSWKPLAIFPL